MIAIVLIAATMSSCSKDEMDINMKDNTENTFTIKVTDYRTGDVIVGAVVKDSQGKTVATTAADGTATYTKKAGDNLLFTVEADGYAAMTAGTSVSLHKLGAKLSGVATYTDKSGNLNVVPSGTELSIQANSSSFVKRVYKTQVGSNGEFEFASLPDGAYFYFVSPTTIGSNAYRTNYSYGFSAGETTSMTVSYSYVNNELPFAIIALPGTVTATGSIVVKFNKAVDTEYSLDNGNGYLYSNRSFTTEWSSDKKTVTFTPTTTWGNVGSFTNIWFGLYTPFVNGGREYVSRDFYVQIVE